MLSADRDAGHQVSSRLQVTVENGTAVLEIRARV